MLTGVFGGPGTVERAALGAGCVEGVRSAPIRRVNGGMSQGSLNRESPAHGPNRPPGGRRVRNRPSMALAEGWPPVRRGKWALGNYRLPAAVGALLRDVRRGSHASAAKHREGEAVGRVATRHPLVPKLQLGNPRVAAIALLSGCREAREASLAARRTVGAGSAAPRRTGASCGCAALIDKLSGLPACPIHAGSRPGLQPRLDGRWRQPRYSFSSSGRIQMFR